MSEQLLPDSGPQISSETFVGGINAFEHVIDTVLRTHSQQGTGASGSSGSMTSRRREPRSLRVKRYNHEGEEVPFHPHDHPEAAPNDPLSRSLLLGTSGAGAGGSSQSSLNASYNTSSQSLSHGNSRAHRMKRYLQHPATISSSESEGKDDDSTEQEEGPPQMEEMEKQSPPPLQKQSNVTISSIVTVEESNVALKAKEEEEEVVEKEVRPVRSRREQENDAKRQAAALATAAILQKNQLKKKPEEPAQTKLDTNSQTRHIEMGKASDEGESTIETQVTRRQALEERKRKLEALAKASALSVMQRGAVVDEKPVITRELGTQTINIDLYTGEVIGKMPALNGSHQRETSAPQEANHPSDSDSSINSSTEYDVPASKANRRRSYRMLLLLVFVAVALVVYFVAFHEGAGDRKGAGQKALTPPLSIAPPTVSPTIDPTLAPTLRPSLRSSTEVPGISAGVTGTPVTTSTPQPSQMPGEGAEVLPTNIDSALFGLLSSEWPSLADSVYDSSTPQARALVWLSSNEGLSTYSTLRKKQRFALATFFFSTSGEQWRKNSEWLSDDNECLWYTTGANNSQCDQQGMYAALRLNFNDVGGSIPPELALLSTGLTAVDIISSGNGTSLSGMLPSEIGLLGQLEFLNLRGNKLGQLIPTEIGSLRRLRRLQLQKNSLSGQIPSEIGLLTTIRQLELSDNQLTGPLPSEIGNLILIIDFHASSNNLRAIPSEVGHLSALATLDLSFNQLSGAIPSELGNLQKLLQIDLSFNSLSGTIPLSLGRLVRIQNRLDLSNNQISGSIPAALGSLVMLRELLLQSNRITGEVPGSFSSMSRLTTLRIESNLLTGQIPENVCSLFADSLPIFVSDCPLACSCCTHCCENGDCQCQVASDASLQFLCGGFP